MITIQAVTSLVNSHIVVVKGSYAPLERLSADEWINGGMPLHEAHRESHEAAFQAFDTLPTHYEVAITLLKLLGDGRDRSPVEIKIIVDAALFVIDGRPMPMDGE